MFRRRSKVAAVPVLPLDSAHFFWALGSLAQLFRIPFDAVLVAQAFPPPYDTLNLQAALRDLGITCGLRDAKPAQLGMLPLPLLAIRNLALTLVAAAPPPMLQLNLRRYPQPTPLH